MASSPPSFVQDFAPLGVAIRLIATDEDLLRAAMAAYAEWPTETPSEARLELRLGFGADVSRGGMETDIGIKGSRLEIRGAGGLGWADATTGRAEFLAAKAAVVGPEALTEALDTLLLFLLCRSGRTPVHAAGIVHAGRALVLAGPSGAGKSTLALAAQRRGLVILSDDTVYIQLRPALRVWGFRRPLHVFPEDASRFTGVEPVGQRLRAGKLKAVVPIVHDASAPLVADRAALIVLSRGERLALDPLEPAAAIAALGPLEAGFDLLTEASARAMDALAAAGAWRLTLTHDPVAAVDFLVERLPSL